MRPSRPGAHPAPQGEVFTPARPALILHSARDDSALVQLSQALRDAHSDLVELETFAAGHTLSWNTNPGRWQTTVTSWLGARVSG